MNKTFRISFTLKNTYRVNGILYAIKQIPILKKWIPGTIYQMRGLKIFANILAILWEVISTFLGKFIYVPFMLVGAAALYPNQDDGRLFLHIFVLLSISGAYSNTYMFNPTKDKYYALILMRMNSREYTLANYFYAIGKLIVGLGAAVFLFCRKLELPLWVLSLLPFFVAGLKMSVAAFSLWQYERSGEAANENILKKWEWILLFVLYAVAYGLPLLNIVLPEMICVLFMVVTVATGLLSLHKILSFQQYRPVYQEILLQSMQQMDNAKQAVRVQNDKLINVDNQIESKQKGFEFLNELFIKRHQKILWKSAKKIAGFAFVAVVAFLVLIYLKPDKKEEVNELILTFLPCFVFVMYAINRGTIFTRALFMNCDHSLLTYPCYKKSGYILKLFQIRLREIIKINLLPASIIGGGLALLLYVSGGTENALNYGIVFVSIICMSIFFSVHYLTIYYLLQPYNAESEIKSGMYQVIMSGTYMICYFMIQLKMSTPVFGMMTIIFCILYCVIASVLVYKLAPRTFKLRT
uniref:hypothetical protein n=1 Tax=Acetatifactor sp. TaxID=1872090 RepID=UPI004056006D